MATFEKLYKTVDGKAIGEPDELLGPTKKVFMRPNGGYSTHLNARDDKRIFPMLVPNQVEVDALLYGRKPTKEQYERARMHADAHPDTTIPLPKGMKGDSKEADAFEKAWHDKMEKAGAKFRPMLNLIK